MRLGIIIYSNDPEIHKNAFNLGLFALEKKDDVTVFLSGKGAEAGYSEIETFASDSVNVAVQMENFAGKGGKIIASHECLTLRSMGVPNVCKAGGINDLYGMIKNSDRVVSF